MEWLGMVDMARKTEDRKAGALKPAIGKAPAKGKSKAATASSMARIQSSKIPGKTVARPRTTPSSTATLASALRTLDLEAEGLQALRACLAGDLAAPFERAVGIMRQATGRVIVTGIGKSGHICRKIAATLASTGTPSYFVHPSEASHGDLGMITRDDVILALSWSGEPVELAGILNFAKRFGVPLIAVTSNAASTLGKAADIALVLPKAKEACPHGLAPTTSTTMQLAIGDALAIALLESRGFTAVDFKTFHPGGKLGASLKHVGEIMHKGDALPLGHLAMPMSQALVVMTQKSFGCIGIVDDAGKLAGIVTDGDLRRHMGDGLLSRSVAEIMTKKPRTVGPDTLAAAALATLQGRITALFVVDDGRPVGIIHVHDLLRTGAA
jgi:arabinose-5-phosphate isomerase